MTLPSSDEIPQQLAAASSGWNKLRRLAAYANFDGWTLSILGSLSLICGGYSSVMGVFIGIALLGAGIFELVTVRNLRRLNPPAINRLAGNQMLLAGVLILYAIISMIQSRSSGGVSPEVEHALDQLGAAPGEARDQAAAALVMIYAAMIAIVLLVQGGTAAYYLSRRKHLQRYLQQTPQWIQQMQRDGSNIAI